MNRITGWICALLMSTSFAFATSVTELPLARQVEIAAIIAVGKVVDVKMTGRFGFPVRDANARTGPSSGYTIWLTVEFARGGLLKGKPESLPPRVKVALWQGWIKDVRSETEASLGRSFVFFLSADLKSTSVWFQHLEVERPEIELIIRGR